MTEVQKAAIAQIAVGIAALESEHNKIGSNVTEDQDYNYREAGEDISSMRDSLESYTKFAGDYNG